MKAPENSEQLLELFINQFGGKIPRTGVNWTSTNSDFAMIDSYYVQTALDCWRVTDDKRCVDMIADYLDWVMSMADNRLPADYVQEVGKWGGRKETTSPQKIGYQRSPRKELSPGSARWINTGEKDDHVVEHMHAFRPEILVDGVSNLVYVQFIEECGHLIEPSRRIAWLEQMTDIVTYHDPSWREQFEHAEGVLFDTPHKGLKIDSYFWPAENGTGEVYQTAPGLNQNAQFLSFAMKVEKLTGKDLGAKDKFVKYCKNTLPHLTVIYDESGEKRIFTLYDFRENPNEKSNDTNHHCHSMPFFRYGPELDCVPLEHQDWIINQIIAKQHTGNGDMTVLAHGSDNHGDGSNRGHPSFHVISECLLFDNGHRLLDIARMTIENEVKAPNNHKNYSFFARLFLAEFVHSKSSGEKPDDRPTETNQAIQLPEKEKEEKPKEEGEKKSNAGTGDTDSDSGTPVRGAGKAKLRFRSVGHVKAIPNSKNGQLKDDGNGLVSCINTWPNIELKALRKGEGEIVWINDLGHKQPPVKVKVK